MKVPKSVLASRTQGVQSKSHKGTNLGSKARRVRKRSRKSSLHLNKTRVWVVKIEPETVEDILARASCRDQDTKLPKAPRVKEVKCSFDASRTQVPQASPNSLAPRISEGESFETFVARRVKARRAVFKAS